jgi:hypothetical protein
MTVSHKAHALGVALANLQGGESILSTECYVQMGFPAMSWDDVHHVVQLAGRMIDADPEFERN